MFDDPNDDTRSFSQGMMSSGTKFISMRIRTGFRSHVSPPLMTKWFWALKSEGSPLNQLPALVASIHPILGPDPRRRELLPNRHHPRIHPVILRRRCHHQSQAHPESDQWMISRIRKIEIKGSFIGLLSLMKLSRFSLNSMMIRQ